MHKLLTHIRSFHAGRGAVVPQRNPNLHSPPTTGDNEPVKAAYLYPDAVPQPPSPRVPASHLPLSISAPPGRLARDGSAPLVQNRSAAEGVWGRHDPLRD